jgi:hypothetical protein
MAEREGFEPPIPVKVWLISSQLHSTGLCHLSALDGTADIVSLLVNECPEQSLPLGTRRSWLQRAVSQVPAPFPLTRFAASSWRRQARQPTTVCTRPFVIVRTSVSGRWRDDVINIQQFDL